MRTMIPATMMTASIVLEMTRAYGDMNLVSEDVE